MNLRPLALSLSLLAAAAPAAFAQQLAPQESAANDLGFTPAQMAEFAGAPAEQNVVYATAPEQPQFNPGQFNPGQFAPGQFSPGQFNGGQFNGGQYGPGQFGYPAAMGGQPGFAPSQAMMMGYPGQLAGYDSAAPDNQPANPQQAVPPGPAPAGQGPGLTPNWPDGNMPQPMVPGAQAAFGCNPPAAYGPGAPIDAYGGAVPNQLAVGGNPPRPSWYFRGDNVWLNRSRANDHNLTTYDNLNNTADPRNGHVVLDTNEVTYPLEPGMRLTLGRYLTDTWMVEATYFGDVSWDRRNGTVNFPTGANTLGPLLPYWGPAQGAFDTSAFVGSNVQTAAYETQFNSIELNVRHSVWATTSIMAGFRYINIGDLFQFSASDNADNFQPGGVGIYRTWTNNNLVGFQLGTEYSHDLWFPRLFGSVDCRGGVYANFCEQKNLLYNSGDTYDQRSSRDIPFATAWDLTFTLSYLATDHLTIRGGYTFFFVNGVALAPDQLDTNPTTLSSRRFIADNDSLLLQGPFAGAEIAW
jgi:hypothetical protein